MSTNISEAFRNIKSLTQMKMGESFWEDQLTFKVRYLTDYWDIHKFGRFEFNLTYDIIDRKWFVRLSITDNHDVSSSQNLDVLFREDVGYNYEVVLRQMDKSPESIKLGSKIFDGLYESVDTLIEWLISVTPNEFKHSGIAGLYRHVFEVAYTIKHCPSIFLTVESLFKQIRVLSLVRHIGPTLSEVGYPSRIDASDPVTFYDVDNNDEVHLTYEYDPDKFGGIESVKLWSDEKTKANPVHLVKYGGRGRRKATMDGQTVRLLDHLIKPIFIDRVSSRLPRHILPLLYKNSDVPNGNSVTRQIDHAVHHGLLNLDMMCI